MIKVINVITGVIVAQYEKRTILTFEQLNSHYADEKFKNPTNLPEPTAAQINYTEQRNKYLKQYQDRLLRDTDHNLKIDSVVRNLLEQLPYNHGADRCDYAIVDTGDLDLLGQVEVNLNS